MRRDRIAAVLATCTALLCAGPGAAQMQLPGALNGTTGASPPASTGGGAVAAPPKPVVIKAPSEDGVVGLALKHDGTGGEMTFEKTGADLRLKKLTLAGDKISRLTDSCQVDVDLATPIVAKPAGRPIGTIRFDVPVPVCPFTIDILDGAVLVTRTEPTCEITAADCRVAPAGVWGPSASQIDEKKAKDLERNRVRLETTMRTNFRVLLKKAGKDRQQVKAIAREQAAFSSNREVMCRDYDRESVHGFCSTQMTEARALALLAQFGIAPDAPERAKKRKPKVVPPSPVAPAMPADPGELQ